jgi:hypothetical protein
VPSSAPIEPEYLAAHSAVLYESTFVMSIAMRRHVISAATRLLATRFAPAIRCAAPVRSLHVGRMCRGALPVPAAVPASEEQVHNKAVASADHGLSDDMAKADLAATPSTDGAAAPMPDPFLSQTKNAFDIKDAELIFRQVWNNLKQKYGEENLSFPKEIMWLAGAPGGGKGAMTPIIQEYRGILAPPIEVGALLTSPAALALKAAGKLIDDRQVVELLFNALMKPEYETGVVVDGFPRTKEQAECIKLLYDHLTLLRAKYASHPTHFGKFRRPIFHVTVLYIDKEESVKRQMRRGQLALHHNEMVQNTGIGSMKPVRETDLSPTLAAERYKMFKEEVFDALKLVKEKVGERATAGREHGE